jgi:hypothetical protein
LPYSYSVRGPRPVSCLDVFEYIQNIYFCIVFLASTTAYGAAECGCARQRLTLLAAWQSGGCREGIGCLTQNAAWTWMSRRYTIRICDAGVDMVGPGRLRKRKATAGVLASACAVTVSYCTALYGGDGQMTVTSPNSRGRRDGVEDDRDSHQFGRPLLNLATWPPIFVSMSRRLFNDRSYCDRDPQGQGRRDSPSVTVTVASIQGGTVPLSYGGRCAVYMCMSCCLACMISFTAFKALLASVYKGACRRLNGPCVGPLDRPDHNCGKVRVVSDQMCIGHLI